MFVESLCERKGRIERLCPLWSGGPTVPEPGTSVGEKVATRSNTCLVSPMIGATVGATTITGTSRWVDRRSSGRSRRP